MSGRGRGRGRGYDRSTRRSFGKKETEKEKQRKKLEDYVHTLGNPNQASDYTIVTKFLVNHIRQEYRHGEDIAWALEHKQDYDLGAKLPELRLEVFESTEEHKKESAAARQAGEIRNQMAQTLYKARINSCKAKSKRGRTTKRKSKKTQLHYW